MIQRPGQQRPVDSPHQIRRMSEPPSLLLIPGYEDQGRQHRDQGHGEDQRSTEGNRDRVRQRREHPSLQTLQRGDRQEDHDDHRHAEDDGSQHLASRAPNDLAARFPSRSGRAQQPDRVFDQHDGAVPQHADGDGQTGESHQVRGHPDQSHDLECRQGGHRQLQRHQQGRTGTTHEEQQNHENQRRTLEQRCLTVPRAVPTRSLRS